MSCDFDRHMFNMITPSPSKRKQAIPWTINHNEAKSVVTTHTLHSTHFIQCIIKPTTGCMHQTRMSYHQEARKRRSRARTLSQDFNLSGVFNSKGTPKSCKSRHSRTPSKVFDYGDRFIPSRSGMNKSVQLHNTTNENTPCTPSTPLESCPTPVASTPTPTTDRTRQDFNEKLAKSLFEGESTSSKILPFKSPTKTRKTDDHHKALRVVHSTQTKPHTTQMTQTHFSSFGTQFGPSFCH